MQEDARKTGLKDGLRQLDYEQLLRVKNYPGQMVLDTYNFDRGLFCPLAIGVGLDRIKQEWTHDTVFHYLTMKGLKVNNTVGIEGSFYTCNRHADLMTAVDGVLEEKRNSLKLEYTDLFAKYGFMLSMMEVDQSVWSQETFGLDSVRGPIGVLEHLSKEVRETAEAYILLLKAQNARRKDLVNDEFVNDQRRKTLTEFADIGLLLMDASRRAGFQFIDLIEAMQEKQAVNMARQWPKDIDVNAPVEHVK